MPRSRAWAEVVISPVWHRSRRHLHRLRVERRGGAHAPLLLTRSWQGPNLVSSVFLCCAGIGPNTVMRLGFEHQRQNAARPPRPTQRRSWCLATTSPRIRGRIDACADHDHTTVFTNSLANRHAPPTSATDESVRALTCGLLREWFIRPRPGHTGQVRQSVRHRVLAVPIHRVAIVVFVVAVGFMFASLALTSNSSAREPTTTTTASQPPFAVPADGASAGSRVPLLAGFGLVAGWGGCVAVTAIRRRPRATPPQGAS